jgi:hypothetical protein
MMTSVASVVLFPYCILRTRFMCVCVCVVVQKVLGRLCSYGLANVRWDAVIALAMFLGRGKVKENVTPPVFTLWSKRMWRYNSTNSYLGTRWSWVISYAPRPLYCRGVALQHLFKKRPKTPWKHSGHCGVDKTFPCRESNPVAHPIVYWLYRQSHLSVFSCFPIVCDWFVRLEGVYCLYTCRLVQSVIIIIGPATLGVSLPPQANVASDLYPGYPPANFYNPVSLRHPLPCQSILISVGHVLVDLQGLSTIFFR